MNSRKKPKYTKEQVIEEIQRIAQLLGKDWLMAREFTQYSQPFSIGTVLNRFGTWDEAVLAAGLRVYCELDIDRRQYTDEELFDDLLRIHDRTGKPPTTPRVSAEGLYGVNTYKRRFGNVPTAFKAALEYRKGNAFPNTGSANRPAGSVNGSKPPAAPAAHPENGSRRKIRMGRPMDFGPFRNEPVDEMGVVALFAAMALDLGFRIEVMRKAFPDVIAKRCIDATRSHWEEVAIELEYRSSHYLEHGHPLDGADLIVAWEHDWKDCPIEVLELKSLVETIRRQKSN